jgi:hypothetical protein
MYGCIQVNLTFFSDLGLECSFSVDYVDYLMFTTLFPIGIVVILLCCAGVHAAYIKYRYHPVFHASANVANRLRQMRAFYSYLLLVWIYLTLPGTSTVIFSMLNAPSDADPNNAMKGTYDRYYLTADLRMSCDSDRYKFGRKWAYAMIFVYPVVSIDDNLIFYYTINNAIHYVLLGCSAIFLYDTVLSTRCNSEPQSSSKIN